MDFKRWQKYGFNDQETILSKYNVILLNHRTRKEKLKALFKRSNSDKRKERRDKIKKTIRMISKGMAYFSKEVNKFSLNEKQTNRKARRTTKGLETMYGVNSANRYDGITHSSRNYSALTNTSRDYRVLTG